MISNALRYGGKTRIKQMSESDIRLYLDRAELDLEAAEANIKEGYHAVAVTRAYYAISYAATAILLSKGIWRSKHSGVMSAFREHFVKSGLINAEFSDIYGDAFDLRLDSDYDLTVTMDRAIAEDILADAERFVVRMERHLREAGAL